MPAILPVMPPEVCVEQSADGSVLYLDAAGVQLATEAGDSVAVLTVAVPLDVLRGLRAILNHPQLAALLDAPEVNPPVA
jgi:hypothetical protein